MESKKQNRIEAVPAAAWTFEGVLCRWAHPTTEQLQRESPPTPEAKPVAVRIIREADYRRLLARAKKELGVHLADAVKRAETAEKLLRHIKETDPYWRDEIGKVLKPAE